MGEEPSKTKVFLIIEDDDDYAHLIHLRISKDKNLPFRFQRADNLKTALECITHNHIGFILLDLSLPDSQGLDTLVRVRAVASGVPIVVLTGLEDESIGIESVRRGAQDNQGSNKYSVVFQNSLQHTRKTSSTLSLAQHELPIL